MDWGLLVRDPVTRQWVLREQRLYPHSRFYWAVAVANGILRFCWTLNFLPLQYLSAAGVLRDNFSWWAPVFLGAAEIVRRSLWSLLRVEWEAIKMRGEADLMTPMPLGAFRDLTYPLAQSTTGWKMVDMNPTHVIGELVFYAAAFAVPGLVIAAHRATF